MRCSKTLCFLVIVFSLISSASHGVPLKETIRDITEEIISVFSDREFENLTVEEKDGRVNRLFNEGIAGWQNSPGYKQSQSSGYFFDETAGPLYKTVISYYMSTGRPGFSLPVLDAAVKNSRKHYAMGYFFAFSSGRIKICLSLGLMDKAKLYLSEFEEQIEYLYDIKQLDNPETYDDYAVFAAIELQKFKLQYLNLSSQFIDKREIEKSYGFVTHVFRQRPYLKYLTIEIFMQKLSGFKNKGFLGEEPNAFLFTRNGNIFGEYARYFVRAKENEKALDSLQKATDNYMENYHNFPGKTFKEWIQTQGYLSTNLKKWMQTEKIVSTNSANEFEWRINPILIPFEKSFNKIYSKDERWRTRRSYAIVKRNVLLSLYSSHVLSGQIRLALGKYEAGLESISQANQVFSAFKEEYDYLTREGLWVFDDIPVKRMDGLLVEAKLNEALSRNSKAFDLYREYIEWTEKTRVSIPVEFRQNFFQSVARQAYYGKIRSAIRLYERDRNKANLNNILTACESVRSRQFKEMLRSENLNTEQVEVGALQSILNGNQAILQISDLDTHIAIVEIHQSHHQVRMIRKPENWDQQIFSLRDRLALNQEYQRDGFKTLTEELLPDFKIKYHNIKRIYLLNDGALSAIPFEILPISSTDLINDHCVITNLPSLQIRRSPFSISDSPAMLAVADPVFNNKKLVRKVIGKRLLRASRGIDISELGITPLPETRAEANEILKYFPGKDSKFLYGTDAKESIIKAEDLRRYSHLHFATHGIIGGEIPTLNEPALVLAWEPGEDSFLTTSEVAKMDLNARITVLSACNTGSGRYFKGEGAMGLGRAFLLAGSKQVIISLWPVDSYATQQLMVHFYEALSRVKDAAQALNLARNKLKVQYPNPFFWSPFIIVSAG